MKELFTYNDFENQIKNEDNEIIKEIINLYNQIYDNTCSDQYYGYIHRIYKKIYHNIINKNRKIILLLIIILIKENINIYKNADKNNEVIKISIKLIKYISLFKNNIPGAKYIDYQDEKLLTVFFTYIDYLICDIDIYEVIKNVG